MTEDAVADDTHTFESFNPDDPCISDICALCGCLERDHQQWEG